MFCIKNVRTVPVNLNRFGNSPAASGYPLIVCCVDPVGGSVFVEGLISREGPDVFAVNLFQGVSGGIIKIKTCFHRGVDVDLLPVYRGGSGALSRGAVHAAPSAPA